MVYDACMASHRRRDGVATPRPPGDLVRNEPGPQACPARRRSRVRWIALVALLVLAAAAGTAWRLSPRLRGAGAGGIAMTPARASAQSPLMKALRLADESGAAKGELPPSDCRPDSMTMVTCMAPAPGITGVVFATYPSLTALYAAYTAKVKALNSGVFRQNYQDCGLSEPSYTGEVAWNHQFVHPRAYSVAQMAAGKITDLQAAGRVFCIMTSSAQEDMVWTQDDGHLLAWVAGEPHEDVWDWWVGIHHNIASPSIQASGFSGRL